MKWQKKIPLLSSLRLITVAGSLCMCYLVCVNNPIATDFYKELGANDFHFGLIGGLPIFMLSFQFIGAFLTNRLRHRKPLFMVMIILGRLIYIPISLMPLIFPEVSKEMVLITIICMIALSSAMMNTTGPLWFSWMADLVPKRVLNHYWGTRQGWMFFTWSATFVWVIVYTYFFNLPMKYAFPLIAIPGVIAGVVDILLFIWVDEPPNTVAHEIPFLHSLTEPLRHKEYRGFLIFNGSRSAAMMCAAAFMQVYLLKVLELKVWKVSLLWAIAGLGMGIASKKWGRTADKYGQKPVFTFCTFMKPIIPLIFIFLTTENALFVLPFFFLMDGFWNAGNMVAINGYMMKISPKKNRSMFIASVTALTGICGGLAAIIAGFCLKNTADFNLDFVGIEWTNYRVLFLCSACFRVVCIFLAMRVEEPKSHSAIKVLNDIRCSWPLRHVRFPVGLYRSKPVDEEQDN